MAELDAPRVLEVRDVNVSFGERRVLEDVSFHDVDLLACLDEVILLLTHRFTVHCFSFTPGIDLGAARPRSVPMPSLMPPSTLLIWLPTPAGGKLLG